MLGVTFLSEKTETEVAYKVNWFFLVEKWFYSPKTNQIIKTISQEN